MSSKRGNRNVMTDLLQRAKKVVVGGDVTGMFISIEDWKSFESMAKLSRWMTDLDSIQDRGWSYTLNEEELGMFALMSHFHENTSMPHKAPRSTRFVGRVPHQLSAAVDGFYQSRRAHKPDQRFAELKLFNDHPTDGVSICLKNGAELVRIAKEYY